MKHPWAQGQLDWLVKYRRELHAIPEKSGEEFKTQAYLWEQLSLLNPDEMDKMAVTGIRVLFRAPGAPGRTLAFRADMDALSICDNSGREFASVHPGMMHACGHDGHMAALLCLARIVSERREKLKEDILLLFQPAEESTGGAKRMLEEGAFHTRAPVRQVYGMHMMPDIPLGKLGIGKGAIMASACEIDIDILGKEAHGATPEAGVDAACAMAHLIVLLQSMRTRTLSGVQPVILTVGRAEAGTLRNIVAAHARLELTLRTFDEETNRLAKEGILRAARSVDALFGTKSRMSELTYYPPVVNDGPLAEALWQALPGMAVPVAPRMIAEDFSFYQQAAPGVFVFAGCGTETHQSALHTEGFDFDEEALVYGLTAFLSRIEFG